ncbi:hypothetical protein H4R35_006787 [Dimargaris xerosporica]|nr:hypothetical protein H4R35_006787 [Dimargaris xerosporica]
MQLAILIVPCGALFWAKVYAQPLPSQEQLVPTDRLNAADVTNVASDVAILHRREEYNPTPEDIALWDEVLKNIQKNGPKYRKGCMMMYSSRLGRRSDDCPDDNVNGNDSGSDSDTDHD